MPPKYRLNSACAAPVAFTSIALGLAWPSSAWHFECRFIERIGTTDHVLPNNTIDASNGELRLIRVQFGVFDDTDGPAPAGGLVGWQSGSLTVGGPEDNSEERRANGRISPFNFGGPEPVVPPDTFYDPFTQLNDIRAVLGEQSPIWQCSPGVPNPTQPAALIRGRNTFVSVYAISIDPHHGAIDYTITAAGDLIAATAWEIVGTPVPPDCSDPNNPVPGHVVYSPVRTAAELGAFARILNVTVPSPMGGALFLFVGLFAARRSRQRQ